MPLRLPKKIRFLLEINTLYSYIFHRILVKIRTRFKLPPIYPYEDIYSFDTETQKILDQMKQAIPDHERGDNPAFNKNWKNVFDREDIAERVSSHIKQIAGNINIEATPAALTSLKDIGYVRLSHKNLNPDNVAQILHYLNHQKVYPSHIAHFAIQKPMAKEIIKKNHPFGSYDMQTILKAPFMAQLLSDKDVIGTITNYFGCLPTVSSINLFWSFTSSDGKAHGPQRFHRDIDDHKTCTMFINLTDTSEIEGAHCYVEKTHTYNRLKEVFSDSLNDNFPEDLNPFQKRLAPEDFFRLPLNGYSFDKLYDHFFRNHMVNLHGPAGTVLITDNYGIHKGMPPRNHDRLILWVSYALSVTHTVSASVKLQKRAAYSEIKDRIENNKINRYVLRNVIDFSH